MQSRQPFCPQARSWSARHRSYAASFSVCRSLLSAPPRLSDQGTATRSYLLLLRPGLWCRKARRPCPCIRSAASLRNLVTTMKYVVKMRPTKLNGKVIGDKGASGKEVIKAVRRSASKYYIIYFFKVMNIRSGGAAPNVGSGSSCLGAVVGQQEQTWVNTATNKSGRRKRYSFTSTSEYGPMSEKEVREALN
ncbi:unnamed protein product [Closterium sp. Naga37s-1]|nr:unnamed protein product [Closterium sp. Naga37s-1]